MTLAEIAVKLTANTAEFISGFGNAGLASKRFRSDLSEHVQAIGGALDGVLSHFGEFGGAIGLALNGASQSAGRAITSFGAMGGAAGTLIGVGAGVAAAVGAVEVGMVGLSVKTALSIAKIGELAQSSGVAVGPLSGLLFVFKATGVESETGVKGIEKLDKAIFKAATSPEGTKNAFTRLGISVRDSQKHIKDADVVFAEIAGKFEKMRDGSVKTALAMEFFGKGGAALVPALNKGKAGIEDFIATAKVLGLYLDDQTVQAAERFKESLATIEAAGTGLSYNLTKQLLPALQTVADFLVSGLKDKSSGLNDLINGAVWLAKAFLAVGETVFAVLKQVGLFVGNSIAYFIELGTGAYEAVSRAAHFDWGGTVAAWQDSRTRMKAIDQTLATDSAKIWSDNRKFVDGVFGTLPKADETKKPKNIDVDTKPAKEGPLERIKARIEALSQEAANWAKVASAGTQAEQLIAEATKKSDEEFGKLKAEAAKSPAALALVIKDEGIIKATAAIGVYGKAIKDTVADLDKTRIKFDEQGKSAVALGQAYLQGGAAIAAAAIDKQLEAEQRKVDLLTEAYERQRAKSEQFAANKSKLAGAAGPVQGENVPTTQLELLKSGVDLATTSLAKLKDELSQVLAQSLTAELIKQGAVLAGTKPYVDALNNSYLFGETAVRKARIELELYRFEQDQLAKGVVLSADQKAKERAILEESDREAYEGALKQEAAQFSLNAQYDSQITKLQRLKEVLQENGQNTLLIDARLHDAQDAWLHQWDEAAFKVGTFSQKFKGVMGELVIQGRGAGQAISQAFVGAIDGVETNLAKLLTGQKTNFKQVAQGLAEQVTKAEIQKGVGALAGKFGVHLPGLTAKADGSSESLALWVKMAGAPGSIAAGSSNPFSAFGIGSDTEEGGHSSGLSGLLSFFSAFGGGKAGGGDMSPGSWYIAGERGPEIVSGPGTVTPNGSGSFRGGHSITQNFHYGNAEARDLFGRTEKQHAAKHMSNLRQAYR